jgi:serine/threonine-protein kinase
MELIPGQTLAEIVAERGRLPAPEAARVGRDVALALQAAHDAGVVHRDVKPGNVMLTRRGEVRVMDFGIASTTSGTSLTATGAAMGTASYISPEQASGDRATPASDVYSLGCVVYEMVAGRPPFDGSNPVAVATAHVRDDPLPLGQATPEAPPALAQAVDQALAKDPARRPSSAAAFAGLLDRAAGTSDAATTAVLAAHPPTRVLTRPVTEVSDVSPARTAPPPRRRHHRAWLLAGILAGLVALAAIVSALTGGDVAKGPAHPSDTPSAGTSLTTVPNVVGLQLPDAVAQLTDAGLGVHEERPANGDLGTIIRTDPAPGQSIRAGASVTLYVGTGPGGEDHGGPNDNGKGKKKHGPGED